MARAVRPSPDAPPRCVCGAADPRPAVRAGPWITGPAQGTPAPRARCQPGRRKEMPHGIPGQMRRRGRPARRAAQRLQAAAERDRQRLHRPHQRTGRYPARRHPQGMSSVAVLKLGAVAPDHRRQPRLGRRRPRGGAGGHGAGAGPARQCCAGGERDHPAEDGRGLGRRRTPGRPPARPQRQVPDAGLAEHGARRGAGACRAAAVRAARGGEPTGAVPRSPASGQPIGRRRPGAPRRWPRRATATARCSASRSRRAGCTGPSASRRCSRPKACR